MLRIAIFLILITNVVMISAAEISGKVVDDGVTIKLVDGAAFWYPESGLLRIFLCSEPIPDVLYEQWEGVVPGLIESVFRGKDLVGIDLYFNETGQPVKSKIKKGYHLIEIHNLKGYTIISDSDHQGVTKSIKSLNFPIEQKDKRV